MIYEERFKKGDKEEIESAGVYFLKAVLKK
jgi:hypothetical protein